MALFFKQVSRVLKWGLLGGASGTSVYYIQQNDWDISQTGVVRIGRAAKASAFIVADYKKTLKKKNDSSISTKEYEKLLSKAHYRSAVRLREMCCANGGVYIKVGQHIGAMEYLLPMEYVETMKVLHSNAPQSDVKDLYRVIQEDLKQNVDEIFDEFDPNPIGAASLAQVHKAKLKDGTVVAVKIQHPHVKSHSKVDIKSMEFLVHMVKRIFPQFEFMWIADETKKNLPKELDFLSEGRHCERVARVLGQFDFLKIPKVYWDFSSERVLTMEFCEGGQINDKSYFEKNNISVNEVSRKLGKIYSEMIFVQGYIHCDPHPGNVLVNKTDKGTEIVLLDHGLYQTLTEEFRLNYCKLWMALLRANMDEIKYYAEKMNAGKLYPLFACMLTARSWEAVTSGIDKKAYTSKEEDEIKVNIAKFIPEMTEILSKVPREMILIFKTNDLLRGIESNLHTTADAVSFITMSKSCAKADAQYKLKHCDGFLCRAHVQLGIKWTLLKIHLYELYLWIQSSIDRRFFSSSAAVS